MGEKEGDEETNTHNHNPFSAQVRWLDSIFLQTNNNKLQTNACLSHTINASWCVRQAHTPGPWAGAGADAGAGAGAGAGKKSAGTLASSI